MTTIYSSYDLNEKAIELSEWVKNETKLPDAILINNNIILKRYIHACEGNLEQAKAKILLCYQIRNEHPSIFIDRDPLYEKSQAVFKICDIVALPKLTPKNYKISLIRLCDYDVSKFDYTQQVKVNFMMYDTLSSIPNETSTGVCDGEIFIFDMQGAALRYFTKLVLSTVRIYMKFTQEAQPIRLTQIHVINCPYFIDRLLSMLKPFMNKQTIEMLHLHQPKSTTIFDYLPHELLPNDYGGSAGYITNLANDMKLLIEENREYLINRKNWIMKDDTT